jgi:non-ribosomal peptide synthetase component F
VTADAGLDRVTAPMSFAQERLWLVDQTAPGSVTYNVPLLNRWLTPVDPVALATALELLVVRYEVLRTTYHLVDGEPVQRVHPAGPVPVEVLDAGSGDEVQEQVAAWARMPFDLTTGPLLRAVVWRGADGGDLMLLVLHHIAVDGWSLAPLYEDLAAYYRRAAIELPELPMRYAEFARRDRESFAQDRRQRLLADRAAELACDEELLLAGARPDAGGAEGARPGRQHRFVLPAELFADVTGLAGRLRATPFVVLHAAFQAVLHRWSARREFTVGAVTANRTHPDVERLVGFFVNTVPMRCAVDPDATFRELCGRTRAESYRSLTYQEIPFGRLTAAVAALRPGGHHRLATVGFAWQNMPPPRIDPPMWTAPEVLPTGTAKFDLLLVVEQREDGVLGIVEYDTDRYPDEVAESVARDYLAVLSAAVTDPDSPVGTMPMPAAAGRSALPEPVVPSRPSAPVHTEAVAEPAALRASAELFTQALAGSGLRVDPGPAANFFALGGNSLSAVTMLAQASRAHGIPLSPRDFLADPTVSGLARLLSAGAGTATPHQVVEPAQATSAQQRFWFLDRIAALRTAYLMPAVVELDGTVDVDALRAAVDQVLAHHPALRARFALDRKLRKVCYRTDGSPATATVTDAAGWSGDQVREHVAAACWTGFDLATDAPAAAEIIRTGDRVLLVLVAHHIAADGTSQRLLLDQIATSYRARLAGGAPVLPPAAHPAAVSVEDSPADDLIAWLSGAPVDIELPHDRPRPEIQQTAAATVRVELDPATTARLRSLATESAGTPFLTTAALLAVTLARTSTQRDFLFTFPWDGRETPEALGTVGMMVNTVPLRVDLRGKRTWRDVLGAVAASGAVSYRNAGASLDAVVGALHPERDLSRPPLTPVYLSGRAGEQTLPAFGAQAARSLPLDPLHIKYELELAVVDDPDRLAFELSYGMALFDRATAAALADRLLTTARELAADPDADPLKESR